MQGVVVPNQLRDLDRQLRGLTQGLQVEMLTIRELPPLFETATAMVRVLTGFQMSIARRIDETAAPKEAGLPHAAAWIAQTSGTSSSAAHEMVAASKRLEHLPATADAVVRGELSTDQAKAIAAAAAEDPDAEDHLLHLAQQVSLKELREECARVKAAADPDPEATRDRLHGQRRVRRFRDEEGFWCLQARGTPDSGAEVNVVLDALIDEIFTVARKEGRHESREAYAYDALVEMARRAWAHMHRTHDSGSDSDRPADCTVKRPRARRRKKGVNPRFLATLRLDYGALTRGWTEGDEVCEIPGTGPISVPAARRLLEDSVVELLVTKGEDVLTRTHARRGLDAAQKVAARWLYPSCARLGCPHPAAEWDHRDPYARDPVTNIRNTDGLCRHDHDLKTHEGWALLPGTGKREMVPPTDPRHPGNPTFHRRRQTAAVT